MSGFDFGSILNQVIPELTMGLVTEERAAADLICNPMRNRTTLSGSFPRMTSKSTLGRADNVGLAPGARAKTHGGGLAAVSYNCLAYVGYDFISDEEANDVAAYGEDLIANRLRQARIDSNLGVDIELFNVLASTTANEKYDCNTDGSGEWDDDANSKPLEDMLAAKHTLAPSSNAIVYGPAVYRALLKHPDFLAETSYFSAGQLDLNAINRILAAKIGIPTANIFYVEKYYNSANEGLTEVLTYLGNEVFWMGLREDLILVDPQNAINNASDSERVLDRRGYEVIHSRYVDIVRPTKAHGVTFSNTIT